MTVNRRGSLDGCPNSLTFRLHPLIRMWPKHLCLMIETHHRSKLSREALHLSVKLFSLSFHFSHSLTKAELPLTCIASLFIAGSKKRKESEPLPSMEELAALFIACDKEDESKRTKFIESDVDCSLLCEREQLENMETRIRKTLGGFDLNTQLADSLLRQYARVVGAEGDEPFLEMASLFLEHSLYSISLMSKSESSKACCALFYAMHMVEAHNRDLKDKSQQSIVSTYGSEWNRDLEDKTDIGLWDFIYEMKSIHHSFKEANPDGYFYVRHIDDLQHVAQVKPLTDEEVNNIGEILRKSKSIQMFARLSQKP